MYDGKLESKGKQLDSSRHPTFDSSMLSDIKTCFPSFWHLYIVMPLSQEEKIAYNAR